MVNMRRREFISLLGAAAAWPVAAGAQQPPMPVVGYLGLTTAEADAYLIAAFRDGLAEAGFVESRNIAIDYLFAERDISRLPALAAELVARKVTVVFTATTVSALAMKAATSTMPIVFAIGADPVKSPSVLWTTHRRAWAATLRPILQNTASASGPQGESANSTYAIRCFFSFFSSVREIDRAFGAFAQQQAGALLVGADPYFNSQRSVVIAQAAQLRLPAIYEWREFAEAGGLMSYGTSLTGAYRQASDFVVRILKGATPADLPVLQSTKFEFVINLKTAKALGLEVPPGLSAIADEVIE